MHAAVVSVVGLEVTVEPSRPTCTGPSTGRLSIAVRLTRPRSGRIRCTTHIATTLPAMRSSIGPRVKISGGASAVLGVTNPWPGALGVLPGPLVGEH